MKAYEAVIVIPKGTTLNIGKVGEQIIQGTGTTLEGNGNQILLPVNGASIGFKKYIRCLINDTM